MMEIQALIAKLSKPHWMPQDPRLVVRNLTPEHIGQLNLMWVFLGRTPITQGFFDKNLNVWDLAGRIAVAEIENIPIREYATLYKDDEFYRFICQHPDVFGRFLTLAMWKKHFVKKRLAGG